MEIKRKKILSSLFSYVRAGKLPLMMCLFPFFSGNKTAMELFRERIELSIHHTLNHKYYGKLPTRDYQSTELKKLQGHRNIWFMWLQGIENAPEICQSNFSYLQRNFGSDVHLITADNVFEYIEIPAFIEKKWVSGSISNTHFSDIVRIQLLSTYGGTWVDATVFVNGDFLKSLDEFCIPRTFKPGSDGHVLPVSSWFIHVPERNSYIRRVRDLLFLYWEENNRLTDYFLLHHFLIIASDEKNNYLKESYPLDNTIPHYLMLSIREKELSDDQIKLFLFECKLSKFTYKCENDIEENNLKRISSLIDETL